MTDDIARIYRAIIADSGVEATDLKVALDELVLQVRPGIESGAIVLDIDDAIRAAGRAIDKRDGGRVDGVLRSIARGEDALELDDDPVLDLVATLGAGRRKIWRFVTRTTSARWTPCGSRTSRPSASPTSDGARSTSRGSRCCSGTPPLATQ